MARGAGPQRHFEVLHIEANAGGSSGGHAAICFTDACFHFEQAGEATIRIEKEDPSRFDFVYRALGNRTIHAQRVQVPAETYARLREAFAAYHRVQSRQLEVQDTIERERRFLEDLLARRRGRPASVTNTLRIPGSGYFFRDEGRPSRPATTSDAVAAVARDIRAVHGSDCLEERAAALRAELARLQPSEDDPASPAAAKPPRPWAGTADRAEELLSALLAVEVLRTAPSLQPDAIVVPEGEVFRLEPTEVQALGDYAARLRASLVRLFASERPDWGYPMLVGLARAGAIDESVDRGRLVLLDVFREDAAIVLASEVVRHAETLSAIRSERADDFAAARTRFFAAGVAAGVPPEMDWSALETAGNLLIELDRALEKGTPLRVHQGAPVPTRSVIRSDWPLPLLNAAELESAVLAARRRENAYGAALLALYPYDVVRRNCVTEIFRTIDGAVAESVQAPASTNALEAASQAQLGGRVRLERSLNFIPFMAARAVGGTYRTVRDIVRPSYRRLALARMRETESPLLVALRESNVVTATVHEPAGGDPVFLFFTEDWPLARPLLGAANLVTGTGATLAGAALLPIDGGRLLRSGFAGAVFSLPELLFVNIRKGSFAFAPRSWLDPSPARESHAPSFRDPHEASWS